MEKIRERKTGKMYNNSERKSGLCKDQLITVEDLAQFKAELLEALEPLLRSSKTFNDKKWLKSYEVRKILGISAGKLLTLRTNGTLPFARIGGVIYYDQQDINQMFENRKLKQ
ncbi:helix-turn-helix domain-containing protein [Taibaiella helva]|uniref:helix-turn-helix domain-containing protein n=1 Tax=Taibaiella helva TaxID=2301235 RepID=UPI001E2D8C34|nr:helix-turn-helix domain-containing protein [Taibaiella helva]